MKRNERETKRRSVVYLYPKTFDLIDSMVQLEDMKSRSEFMEEAVNFYIGYLSTKNAMGYLPEVLVGGLKSLLHENDVRVGNNLFRLTTEISMMANILAVGLDVEDDDLVQLRKKCVEDVKKNRGRNIVDQAVAFQRDDE
ncbi:MAG: hypothetical protein R3Y63_14805 [Eubacteriales bacterium]